MPVMTQRQTKRQTQRQTRYHSQLALLPSILLLLLALVSACDGGGDDAHPNDRFSMDGSTLTGRLLTLDVSYGGGCKAHEFTACWDELVLESDPPMVGVVVLHDGNGDTCEAIGSQTLYIDLQALNSVSDNLRVAIQGGFMGQSISHLYMATDDPYEPVDDPVLTIQTPCPSMRPLAQQ